MKQEVLSQLSSYKQNYLKGTKKKTTQYAICIIIFCKNLHSFCKLCEILAIQKMYV